MSKEVFEILYFSGSVDLIFDEKYHILYIYLYNLKPYQILENTILIKAPIHLLVFSSL